MYQEGSGHLCGSLLKIYNSEVMPEKHPLELYAISDLNKNVSWDMDMEAKVAQTVKNLPAMQETQVQSLGQEDPLEKEMDVHFSILA